MFIFFSLDSHIHIKLFLFYRYISFCYDIMVNLAVTHSDTRIAMKRGLCFDEDETNCLSVRGQNDSPMLESIDSNQMVKNLTAAQKYHLMDYFVTFTCNQSKHFGTKPIKNWLDWGGWKRHVKDYDRMTSEEQDEIKNALNQSAAGLLCRAWNETCRYFLEYLRNSPTSPFKDVDCMFARHEYQKDVGNLHHIHAMIRINPDIVSADELNFTDNLIRASVMAVVTPADYENYEAEGIFKSFEEVKPALDDAMKVLPHICNERCLKAVGENEYRCRAQNYLLMSKPPNNTRHNYVDLPNQLSQQCLKVLEKLQIVDRIKVHDNGYVEPFKSRLDFFHPKRHVPPVLWTHDMNISPVESKTFVMCRSMQNIQRLTATGGCNKYVVKYLSKIDEQNYVIISTDVHKNGVLKTREEFIHNSKISSSKYFEDAMKEHRKDKNRPRGRAISIMEMLHSMLKYSEVTTDLRFEVIPTTPLELRPGITFKKLRPKREDAAEVGVLVDSIRRAKRLPAWRQLSEPELLVAQDTQTSNTKIDKITQFSLRPPELRKLFDKVGEYFRWFVVSPKKHTRNQLNELIDNNILFSGWIDSVGCTVKMRKKAIDEVCDHLNEVGDPEDDMVALFSVIQEYIEWGDEFDAEDDFIEHVRTNLIYDDDKDRHLPIPVYSYVRPSLGVQFILHLMLSCGRFSTELELTTHATLRESLAYAKLIGPNEDEESLTQYAYDLLRLFIEDQLIYFPNSRKVIDSWIVMAHDLLIEVIVKDNIPISDIPPVLTTSLYAELDEKQKQYVKESRNEVIRSALNELERSRELCQIPTEEELENATKAEPLDWDAYESFQHNPNISHESFQEQRGAIKMGADAIDKYCDPLNTSFVKCMTLRGLAGCGKSHTMQYLLAYALSKGLNCVTTSWMARRSIALGGKHLHKLFCLPTDSRLTCFRSAELSCAKLNKKIERENLLRTIDVMFLDEIGQVSSELLSVLDIIFRRVRGNSIFMGGVLVFSTIDHTQLPPVSGHPFLLSSHVVTCFKMFHLKHSVRAANDNRLQGIISIASMHPSEYTNDPDLLSRFRELVSESCTHVDSWSDPEITPSTFRLYGKKVPANEATTEFVENVRRNIDPNLLRVKVSKDMEKNRFSHSDWERAGDKTREVLDKKVKEPHVLVLFPGAVYEFTRNSDSFTQSQIGVLTELPSDDDLQNGRRFSMWLAPAGQRTIEYENHWDRQTMVSNKYSEVFVSMLEVRIISYGRFMQCFREQLPIKPRHTSTIHAAQGETLSRVALKVDLESSKFNLWDKAQVIVALSRTNYARDLIFVGEKNSTLDALVKLIQKTSQWSDYMEAILKLVTVNAENIGQPRYLTQCTFPFRMIDIALPTANTGYVYFLLSKHQLDYVYIGMTNCIRQRLKQHNTGYSSTLSTPVDMRPYILMSYICGCDGNRPLMRFMENRWQDKVREMKDRGQMDWREWAKKGLEVIREVPQNDYNTSIEELRLVHHFVNA